MRIAHVSDLHVGRAPSTERACYSLVAALLDAAIDHVVVTGDVTHNGRLDELIVFRRIFGPLIAAGRLSVVPGNHDRLGDDVGRNLMGGGKRVDMVPLPGVHLVRIDSTGAHNRSRIAAHGVLDGNDLDMIDNALDKAPAGHLVALALHHHPLPLPEETLVERVAQALGWPNAAELAAGRELVARAQGRCDLILHGHRHIPRMQVLFPDGDRPLRLHNAGSSSEQVRARIFQIEQGRLVTTPSWLAPVGERVVDDRGERAAPERGTAVLVPSDA